MGQCVSAELELLDITMDGGRDEPEDVELVGDELCMGEEVASEGAIRVG
jgi:hypothetical protein